MGTGIPLGQEALWLATISVIWQFQLRRFLATDRSPTLSRSGRVGTAFRRRTRGRLKPGSFTQMGDTGSPCARDSFAVRSPSGCPPVDAPIYSRRCYRVRLLLRGSRPHLRLRCRTGCDEERPHPRGALGIRPAERAFPPFCVRQPTRIIARRRANLENDYQSTVTQHPRPC